MDDIGRHNDVEIDCAQTEGDFLALDIEEFEAEAGMVRQRTARPGQERGGDIREPVGVLLMQQRHEPPCGGAGTRSDFEQTEWTPRREVPDKLLERIPHQGVESYGGEGVGIEALDQ